MEMSELCTRGLVAIHADASVREAVVRMCDEHVGCIAVTDGHQPDTVLGVVTDRDIALGALGAEGDPRQLRVGALVSGPPIAVRGTADVGECLQVMLDSGVRRVLVLGENGDVLGLVSSDDIAQVLAGHIASYARLLGAGVARESATRATTGAQPKMLFPAFGRLASL